MLLRYLFVAFVLAAVVSVAGGCAAPLVVGGGLFARRTPVTESARIDGEGDATVASGSAGAKTGESATDTPTADEQLARLEAMSTVVGELEEIRRIDPAAHHRLMTELTDADPETWQLMVQQFHTALTYREDVQSPPIASTRIPQARSASRMDDRGDISNWKIDRHAARTIMPPVNDESEEIDLVAADWPASRSSPVEPDDGSPAENQPPQPPRPTAANANGSSGGQSAIAAAFDAVNDSPTEVTAVEWCGMDTAPNKTLSPAAGPPDHAEMSWQQHLAAAIQSLSTTTVADPQSSAEVLDHARLRLLQVASGESDAALEPIPSLSTVEQDYWTKQLFALATYTDSTSPLDQKRRAALAADHLEDALVQLRQLGSLSVENLAFCTKVYDFGAYEEFPSDRFAPGRQVTLYAEVENFSSQQGETDYLTSLASSYEIVDDAGQRVGGGRFPDVEDHCRNRRRDFHIQYTLPLPATAAPGNYRLKLLIEDNLSDKRGQNSVEFEIAATDR